MLALSRSVSRVTWPRDTASPRHVSRAARGVLVTNGRVQSGDGDHDARQGYSEASSHGEKTGAADRKLQQDIYNIQRRKAHTRFQQFGCLSTKTFIDGLGSFKDLY